MVPIWHGRVYHINDIFTNDHKTEQNQRTAAKIAYSTRTILELTFFFDFILSLLCLHRVLCIFIEFCRVLFLCFRKSWTNVFSARESSFELNLFVAFSLFFSFIYFCSCKWQTVHDLLFYCSNAVDKWLQGITWGSLFIFACQIQPRDFFRIVCHAFNEYCTSTTWSINLINDSSDFVSFSPEWFWSQCIWFDSGSLCVGLTSIWSLRLEICSVLASQMRADSFLGSRMEKCRHFYHWCRENQARRGMRKARASERRVSSPNQKIYIQRSIFLTSAYLQYAFLV